MPQPTLTRRTVLQAAGALTLFHANSGSAAAAASAERKLVIVILRGAADGLSAVPAFADPDYARLRSRLAIAPPSECPPSTPIKEQICRFLCAWLMSVDGKWREVVTKAFKILKRTEKFYTVEAIIIAKTPEKQKL